jgi:hypothetical protein
MLSPPRTFGRCLLSASAEQETANPQSSHLTEQLKHNLDQSIERIKLLLSAEEAHLEEAGKKKYVR